MAKKLNIRQFGKKRKTVNRKGVGPIGFVFLFIFLLVMYPFVIAPQLTQAGKNAIASGATGLEAFLWTNLNLWVILTLVIVVAIYYAMGGGARQ